MSSDDNKADTKAFAQQVLLAARLKDKWQPSDNVEDIIKAMCIVVSTHYIDKPSKILGILMASLSDNAAQTLQSALVEPGTYAPKLKPDADYIKNLGELIRTTFLPRVLPYEALPDLVSLKYKANDTSINNHIDLLVQNWANAIRGLAGSAVADDLLKGIGTNNHFINRIIPESLPEYLRMHLVARDSKPTTLKDMRALLENLDAQLSHRKALTPSSPSETASKGKGKGKDTKAGEQSPKKDRPEAPPNPCKWCGGNHWNDECKQKPDGPAGGTRGTYNKPKTAPSSTATIPPPPVLAGGLAKDTTPKAGFEGGSLTAVPITLTNGAQTLKGFGVFDDCNFAAPLLTESAAVKLNITRCEPTEHMEIGGAKQPIIGYATIQGRIAFKDVTLACYVVKDGAIPIPGCNVLLTGDNAYLMDLTRIPAPDSKLGRIFKAEGVRLNITSDLASTPNMPTKPKGKALAARKRAVAAADAEADRAADRSAVEFLTMPEPPPVAPPHADLEDSTEDIGGSPIPGLSLKFDTAVTIKKTIILNGTAVDYTVGAGLTDEQYARIETLLKAHERQFYHKGRLFTYQLPVKHKITTNGMPRKVHPRDYKGIKQEAARAIVKDWLARGIIRISEHPQARHYENPLHVVVKDESKINPIEAFRATVDGRATNDVTVRNHARSVKTVHSVINHVAKCDWISKLDGKDFYLQQELEADDRHKSGFTLDNTKYEFIGAIFGLAFPGDTVEANLEILKQENSGYVENFVDDFFIGAPDTTADEHLDQLEAWLKTLAKYDVVVNIKDICIACPKVLGLGYHLGGNTIGVPYDRREALKDLARPMDRNVLSTALMTYNYYREHIPHYADFHARFADLLKEGNPWIWTQKHDDAWEDFKAMLDDEANGIAMPYDPSQPSVIRTDASEYGLGATLLQYDPKWRKLRPVYYFSGRLDDADVKIAGTTVKEAFSGHASLMHWAPLLHGRRVLMQYDHMPIIGYVPKNTSSAGKHWRWHKDYMAFDVKFEHIPGKLNSIADLLSRLVKLAQESDLPGATYKLLADKVTDDPALNDIRAHVADKAHVITDAKAKEILKELGGTAGLELINNVLFFSTPGRFRQTSRRVLLPESLIKEYLDVAHADPTSGHLRGTRFRDRLTHVWWSGKERNIAFVEDNCAICHRSKSANVTYTGTLKAADPITPFYRWHVDYFTIFDTKVINAVEDFTGYPMARIVTGETSDTAMDHTLEILSQHGRFTKLRSDRGPAFTSAEFKAFCDRYLITQEFSDPDRPETNGKVERMNRTLEDTIRCILPSLNNNLNQALLLALYGVRSATNPRTRFSPFQLATGRKPLLFHPLELDPYAEITDVKDFATQLLKNADIITTQAMDNSGDYRKVMQRLLDERAVPHPFKTGDLVGVARDFDKNHDIARYDGPFKITDVPSANTVTVDVPPGPKNVNVSKVKLYNGTGQVPTLPTASPAEREPSSWMEPPPNLLPEQLLFKRVKVRWPDNKWFTGTVRSIYHNKHFVYYDDMDAFKDPYVPEGLTLPKKRPKYRVLTSDFGPIPGDRS